MKTHNLKKYIAQRGGLMIEALAMLGLISVITPTMYKKSAERTMEVEDINTATSMRTYLSAAEAYLNSNYPALMKEFLDNGTTVKTITNEDLVAFLPYKFNTNRNIYNYNPPVIRIVKNNNNLTAFTLFPALADADNGIGQERTARIASLIGAGGGYVTETQKARGVGGIWNLDQATYKSIFGNGDTSNVYSIVAASSNAVSDGQGGEMDNEKYLSRVNEGVNEQWRNSMRTDLYLGGPDNNDEYKNTPAGQTMHSIRQVKSMIVGANAASNAAGDADENTYGLYIANTTNNTSAYIYGALKAGNEEFIADATRLGFGNPNGGTDAKFRFQSDKNGNIYNYGSVYLADNMAGGSTVNIGNLGNDKFMIYGENPGTPKLTFFSDDTFTMSNTADSNGTYIKIAKNLYTNPDIDARTPVSYSTTPKFPVSIGTNTQVGGILSANVVDTNKIRAKNLAVGAATVDAEYKWLNANENGVTIADPVGRGDYTKYNALIANQSKISLQHGTPNGIDAKLTLEQSDGMMNGKIVGNAHKINLSATKSNIYMNGDEGNEINISTDYIKQQLLKKEFIFNGKDTNDFRVLVDGGHMDLVDTNFRVTTDDGRVAFSIRGNEETEKKASFGNDTYNHPDNNYKIVATGEFLVNDYKGATNSAPQLSVGLYNTNAAVNISRSSETAANAKGEVVFVDTSADEKTVSTDVDGIGGGTIYIRKGMVEATSSSGSGNSATKGYGIIRGSRFVANNVDAHGNDAYDVDQLVDATTYAQYNGRSNQNRYDTYMVNPAYTSVMHDIKLTTRGGARLSDILPDFIIKGIYLARNNYTDNITDFNKIALSVSGGKLSAKYNGSASNIKTAEGTTLGYQASWASPYLGAVPAPQCPPGYARYISIRPTSFLVGQTGELAKEKKADGTEGTQYYVDPYVNSDLLKEKLTNPDYQTKYREIEVGYKNSNDTDINIYNEGGGLSGQITKIQGLYGMAKNNPSASEAAKPVYVLSSLASDKGMRPFTFQQSTWLKTHLIAHSSSKKEGTHLETDGYTYGWTAYMGFIYPSSVYKKFVTDLGVSKPETDSMYWNLFPVMKNTLEAELTTYCYFDRSNSFGSFVAPGEYIDNYHSYDNIPASFSKRDSANSSSYINRLNDPTLKYDEVW